MAGIEGRLRDNAEKFRRALNRYLIVFAPDPLIQRLAEPYIAGHSFPQGVASVRDYFEKGRLSTVDILGERPKDVAGANRIYNANFELIDLLGTELSGTGATLSTKITSLCAVETLEGLSTDLKLTNGKPVFFPETNPKERLESVVRYTRKNGVDMTLDAEESALADTSQDLAQYLWGSGYDNFGIVLQSRLNRTEHDIQELFVQTRYPVPNEKLRVRAVIGIYLEPKEVATTSKSEAKERLVKRVEELLDAGVYVEIGTHDHSVIRRIVNEIIKPNGVDPSKLEFGVLKGIRNGYSIERELMDAGYTVRYYMPVEINEGDGLPYMKRRLIANPTLVMLGAKNFFQMQFTGRSDRV